MTDTLSKKFKTEYLCKDCKHSFMPLGDRIVFPHRPAHIFKCKKGYRESEKYQDPVVGCRKTKADYEACSIMRLGHSDCGPNAKFWAPRRKKDIFKFINKEHDE